MLVVIAEALGLRPHQIHAAADQLADRQKGETTPLRQQKRVEMMGRAQMSAAAFAPAPMNRAAGIPARMRKAIPAQPPSDPRLELAALIKQLSEDDLEMVLDLAKRLQQHS